MNNFIILKLERLAQYSLLSDRSDIPDYLFFMGAIIFSYVYGVCAFEIHNIKLKGMENKWYINNQYWLNGLGGICWLGCFVYFAFSSNGRGGIIKKSRGNRFDFSSGCLFRNHGAYTLYIVD